MSDQLEPCPYCLAQVDAAATRCRYCGGELTKSVSAPDLGGFWVAGLLLAALGAVIAANSGGGAWFGLVLAVIGGIILQIAVIATGVSIGMRDRDERTWINRQSNARDVTT